MEGGFSWQSPSSRLVMDAVLDILAEVGYDGLTVHEVKARAGAAAPALGELPDLDALARASLTRIKVLEAPAPTGSLREDLRALLRPWRSPRTRDEVIVAAVLSAAQRRSALSDAVLEALDRPVAQALGAVLSRHIDDPRVAQYVQTLSWILRGLFLERLRTGSRAPVDLDRLVDFLIAGLGASAPELDEAQQ